MLWITVRMRMRAGAAAIGAGTDGAGGVGLRMLRRTRMRAGVGRYGHLGITNGLGVHGAVVDRVVPVLREKEFRGPICELDKIPAR